MVARDIGIVICRVGAVLLFVQAIQGLVFSLEALERSALAVPDFFTSAALVTIGPAVGGLVLWFLARPICAPGKSADDSGIKAETDVGKADIVAAGTYLLGVYVVTFAIVDLVQLAAISLYPLLYEETAGIYGGVPNPLGFSRFASIAAQFILGAGLIFLGRRSD